MAEEGATPAVQPESSEKEQPSPPEQDVPEASSPESQTPQAQPVAASTPAQRAQEQKAQGFIDEAEKKIRSSQSFFGGLFGLACFFGCV